MILTLLIFGKMAYIIIWLQSIKESEKYMQTWYVDTVGRSRNYVEQYAKSNWKT